MDLKQFFKKPYAWIIVAFVAGFAVNQLLTGMHLNPMQGKAFMAAEYGGLPVDCTSFYGDTINCWRNSFNQNRWWDMGGGGGYGGGTSNPGSTYATPTPSCPPVPGDFNCNGIPDDEENQQPGNTGSGNPTQGPENTVGEGDTCVFRHGVYICYN